MNVNGKSIKKVNFKPFFFTGIKLCKKYEKKGEWEGESVSVWDFTAIRMGWKYEKEGKVKERGRCRDGGERMRDFTKLGKKCERMREKNERKKWER